MNLVKRCMFFFFVLLILASTVSAARFMMQEDLPLVTNIYGVNRNIVLIDVSEYSSGSRPSCIFTVDGNIGVIREGQNKVIDGIRIFVLDAYPIHSQLKDQDRCEVIIGGNIISYEGSGLEQDSTDTARRVVPYYTTTTSARTKPVQITASTNTGRTYRSGAFVLRTVSPRTGTAQRTIRSYNPLLYKYNRQALYMHPYSGSYLYGSKYFSSAYN